MASHLIKVIFIFHVTTLLLTYIQLFQNGKFSQLTKLCQQGYVSQIGSRCLSSGAHLPVTKLTEEESAIRDLAAKVSREKIAPLVRKMDQESKMDKSIIKALFENGVSVFQSFRIFLID